MKKLFWIIIISILFTIGCGISSSWPELGYAQDMRGRDGYQSNRGDIDMDYIYNYLEPYGNWVDMEPYGYVWTPRNMGYRWRPYSDGQWVSTDSGWTWIAHEAWGSIPFHFGRWGYDNDFGWFWVPGTLWGPAWVSWRWSDQYVGWAPLPPGSEFHSGRGFASLSYRVPNRFWIFLQSQHFMDRDLYHYTIPYERNVTIINFTSLHLNIRLNQNRIINDGIGMDYVRRVIRKKVPHYTIRDIYEPRHGRVNGNDVHIYRPNFRENTKARPKSFMNRNDARHKLSSAKVYESREKLQKNRVLKRQSREKELLRTTQLHELTHMKNKRTKALAQKRDKDEKIRISQDNQRKTAALKQRHQIEKQQLSKRNKHDLEKIKQIEMQRKKEAQHSIKNKNKKKHENKNKKK